MRRVVVTGLGAVTPVGNTVEEFWRGLTSGICGIELISSFDVSEMKAKIAAQVKKFDPTLYFEKKRAAPYGFICTVWPLQQQSRQWRTAVLRDGWSLHGSAFILAVESAESAPAGESFEAGGGQEGLALHGADDDHQHGCGSGFHAFWG